MDQTVRVAASGDLFFGVDARHIQQLGQELVGDRATAVTELIKNAYDADATQVELRFLDAVKGPGGVLEIADNGNGMTLDDIERGWMRISTADKENEPTSPVFGRTRAGRKGIGRFATETLGRRLRLWTTVEGHDQALVVEFNWRTAYAAGVDLTTVANPYHAETVDPAEHGTTLRIEDLYHAWDGSPRDRVKKAIRLLQPPFPVAPVIRADDDASEHEPDPGFSVSIVIDGVSDDLAVPGYDEFLAAATARLSAHVTADGDLVARLTSERLNLSRETAIERAYPTVGPFTIDAAYFIYRRETIGGIGVRIAQAMAEQYAGVRLYRDGLRVMPYGERDNDWLGLDELSSSRSGVLVPVRNRNWFGQIAISRVTNPDLRDTASREGVVETEAFEELRKAARVALEWTAVQVAEVRHRKISAKDRPSAVSRDSILESARSELVSAATAEFPPKVATQVQELITRVLAPSVTEARLTDVAESERLESLLGEVELLRILASLGTSIAVFSHEVRTALNTTVGALEIVEQTCGGSGTVQSLTDARKAMLDVGDLAGYVDAYVSATHRRKREAQPLHAVIREFVDRLSRNLARGVAIEWKVSPSSLRTEPMARSELEAVLINLLTNAIKAMDSEHQEERRVLIDASLSDGQALIRFQDTGTGIRTDVAERIFDAFFTDTKTTVSELGVGTGLGLKIVWDIAEANGGSVSLGEPDDGYATCFELRLPRWRRQEEVT
jgi:signal transduction histidine kinase